MRKLLLLMTTLAGAIIFIGHMRTRGNNPWLDNYQMRVFWFDLKKDNFVLTPVLPENGSETFSDMVQRLKPIAAINGTFFDSNNRVLGDVVIGGKIVHRGGQRHAIGVTKNGDIRFLHRGQKRFDWTGIEAGLASGPLLIRSGKIALDPVADGFKPASKDVRAWRSAVGVDKDGKLLLVVVEQAITLFELANIMIAQDAREALNLDGGSATALYSDSKVLVSPTVEMTNILVVLHK